MKNSMVQSSCRRFANAISQGALLLPMLLLPVAGLAQVSTGSNGSDGPLNPTVNAVIDMALRPNGIYQYTSVNIPANVTVTFTPNANNTPVVWLVQGNVVINGTVDVSGQSASSYEHWTAAGAAGGPGGYRGGDAGAQAGAGQGPGGGAAGGVFGESAAFGAVPTAYNPSSGSSPHPNGSALYGNQYLLPLVGGSGGGGSSNGYGDSPDLAYYGGGGGGGGAILIAASGQINIAGSVNATGGQGGAPPGSTPLGGGGSGGAVRLVSQTLVGVGSGRINCDGGGGGNNESGGLGRVRLDVVDGNFGGQIAAVVAEGFQPIIMPGAGQGVGVVIASVGGVPVSASPTGVVATPDAVISAQQANPIPIVVQCSNLPLGTPITVSLKPMNGSAVSAVGHNAGTLASSTATVLLNMPRGGGLVYATAATGN